MNKDKALQVLYTYVQSGVEPYMSAPDKEFEERLDRSIRTIKAQVAPEYGSSADDSTFNAIKLAIMGTRAHQIESQQKPEDAIAIPLEVKDSILSRIEKEGELVEIKDPQVVNTALSMVNNDHISLKTVVASIRLDEENGILNNDVVRAWALQENENKSNLRKIEAQARFSQYNDLKEQIIQRVDECYNDINDEITNNLAQTAGIVEEREMARRNNPLNPTLAASVDLIKVSYTQDYLRCASVIDEAEEAVSILDDNDKVKTELSAKIAEIKEALESYKVF